VKLVQRAALIQQLVTLSTKEVTMWRSSPRELQRWLALGGLIAPVLFVTAVIVTAAARPDYRHDQQMISLLGELGGPRAAVMNFAGFLLYGVLVLGLAAGLHAGIRNGSGDWLGPLLVGVYGLGYIAVAFAPCSPGCTGASSTPSEQAHFLISRVIFMAAVAAPLTLFARLAKDPAWSILRFVVVLFPSVGYLLFILPLPGVGAGSQQRLFIGCTLGWILVLAWRLFRLTAPAATSAPAAA
jgi:Protein of unknown function (DUF998)